VVTCVNLWCIFVYVVGLRLICSVDHIHHLEMILHYTLPLVSVKTISHETPYRIWFGVLRKIMVTCPWHVVRDSKSLYFVIRHIIR